MTIPKRTGQHFDDDSPLLKLRHVEELLKDWLIDSAFNYEENAELSEALEQLQTRIAELEEVLDNTD